MPEGVTDPNYKPLPGRLGNLSVEQQHILTKFRTQLQDRGVFVPERMDDAFLLRCATHLAPNARDHRLPAGRVCVVELHPSSIPYSHSLSQIFAGTKI